MDTPHAEAVARAFGMGPIVEPPTYVARGAMGEIWRLETANGRWAVKALFEWDPPPPLPDDIAVQRAALAAGLRLPRPVLTAEGTAVACVSQRLFRAYDWIDLAEPLALPVGTERAAEAGDILGTIHALGLPVVGAVDRWYLEAPDAGRWPHLVARSKEERSDWSESLIACTETLIALASFTATGSATTTVVCHRDFEPANVPVDIRGRLVTLDWENAGPLDPAAEVAYALLAWTAGPEGVDTMAVRSFLDAYAARTDREPALDQGSFGTAAATYLNFASVMADQALDDSGHKAFAEQQLRALLEGCGRLHGAIEAVIRLLDLPRRARPR